MPGPASKAWMCVYCEVKWDTKPRNVGNVQTCHNTIARKVHLEVLFSTHRVLGNPLHGTSVMFPHLLEATHPSTCGSREAGHVHKQ